MNQVEQLESAILDRANRLASEYRERAERSRDRIIRDAAEQLRLREDREVLLAKAHAERTYRRRVQASELQLQSNMDLMRWNLVQTVFDRLAERFQALVKDDAEYLPLLQAYLAQGARLIERDELVADLSARDHKRLRSRWQEFAEQAAPDKVIHLAPDPIECIGGAIVRSSDDRIRLDNTFDGRRERLRSQLYQTIIERLLPASLDSSVLFTG